MAIIDLSQFYTAAVAAEVISRNSGEEICPAYVRKLASYNKLTPLRINGRLNLYPREQVDGIIVRKQGRRGEDSVA
jgi:hypothetical protein